MTAPAPADRPSGAGLRLWIPSAALLLVWLAMLLLGGGDADQAIVREVHVSQRPWVVFVILATRLGDWEILVGLAFFAAAWLLYRRRVHMAVLLFVSTLLGRALIEVQKLVFGRLRPEQDNPMVVVESFAYPSGHAGNSMIVFLLLALLLVEDRRRRKLATLFAILASLLIGASRILLGVHWPSDVMGGWAFGLLWVLLSFRMRRSGPLKAR